MKTARLISIILLCLFIASCAACRTDKQEDNEIRVIKKMDDPNMKLAPGTVDLLISIKSFEEMENKYILDALVSQVNKYGSAAAPLAVGENIKIAVSPGKVNKDDLVSATNNEHFLFNVLIKNSEPVMNQITDSIWNAISIKKK